MNLSYMAVLDGFGEPGGDSIVATPAIAITAVTVVVGSLNVPLLRVAPVLIALLVSVSASGSTNAAIMTGGRYIYAIARAGEAPGVFSRLSRWDTPYAVCGGHRFSSSTRYAAN